MDATSADPTATQASSPTTRGKSRAGARTTTAKSAAKTAAKAPKDDAKADAKPRKQASSARAPSRPATDGTSAPPFLPIDVELLEDIRDLASRKARAIVRDKPMAALGGAFAVGFLIGGGWRTRVGRLILFAANRYLVFQAAKRELGV
jgi:hypothetical protein